MKTPKIKLWFEDESNQEVFGKGNCELLRAIDQYGSINESAKQLNMNYKKAWNKKTETEDILGGGIFISKKGASKDSGTSLSPKAIAILQAYEQLEKEINEFSNKRFKELFKDLI